MYTSQSKKHKNNMIGQKNPVFHTKPVNRKKKKVIGKINKVMIVPNIETDKIEVRLIGANRAGEVGFILRKYTGIKKAAKFFNTANLVKSKKV